MPIGKESDEQLLRRVRSGSEEALAVLIDRYTAYAGTVVHNIVYGRLGPEDEKEILSDCFCLLWQNVEKVQAGKLKAYLAAIARSRALNALRRARPDVPLEDAVLTVSVPGPETEAVRRDAEHALRRSLDALGEPDRSIFFRHYYYCQSAAEIGAALGINPNTVHTKLRRGREKLRQELEKGGYTLETEDF